MVQESSSAHAVHTIIKIKTSTKHAKSAQTYTIKKNIKKPKNSLYREKVFSLSKQNNHSLKFLQWNKSNQLTYAA